MNTRKALIEQIKSFLPPSKQWQTTTGRLLLLESIELLINRLESTREQILTRITNERERQDNKHGEQYDLESVSFDLCRGVMTVHDVVRLVFVAHGLPSEETARTLCDVATSEGKLTYAHIVVEELSEAVAAFAVGNEEHGIKELVETAASVVKWIEVLERRKQLRMQTIEKTTYR